MNTIWPCLFHIDLFNIKKEISNEHENIHGSEEN